MELKFSTTFKEKIKKSQDELQEFIYYVDSFYNIHSGITPIATRTTIEEAISIYLLLAKEQNLIVEFDSIDREHVRLIIEEINKTKIY